MPEIRIKIPDSLDFSALRLARDADGMVSFDWTPIEKICTLNNLDFAIFRDAPEDNLAALLTAWYADHLSRGVAPDPVQEDLIAEAKAEDALGGGFSHAPGRA